MPSKLLKIYYRHASALTGNIPLHWHLGRPNFGDDINPWIFSKIAQNSIKFVPNHKRHILGIGSILERVSRESVVIGSGYISRVNRGDAIRPYHCFSVRGKLSAEIMGVKPSYFGDVAALVNILLPMHTDQSGPIGYIPHVSEKKSELTRKIAEIPGVKLINPGLNFREVVAEICGCRKIASQSLHGLIVADAYGVPATWVAPSDLMIGGDYKFNDYFTTQNKTREPVHPEDLLRLGAAVDFSKSEFIYNKQQYLSAIRELIDAEFPVLKSA